MDVIRFHLDGRLVEVNDLPPTTTALQYLRRHRHQTGTKEGCAEGDCGACTIAVLDGGKWRAINSCLVMLPMLHGKHVVTVEGLADGETLHPVQDAMVRHLGSQCGYCTPGVVMTMFEGCYRDDLREDWQVEDQMCGTLCRCTGYRPIREAAKETAGLRPDDAFLALEGTADADRSLAYAHGEQRFFLPTTFDALFAAMADNPDHQLICGATDLGLSVTKKHVAFSCLVSLEGIDALRGVTHTGGVWRIGASTPLSELESATDGALVPVARMLRYFGARQIKNRGTVGGNLCNASPIGDLAPVLLALDATCIARSARGERRIPLSKFFLGYRETALEDGEILAAVEVSDPPADARIGAYKVSKRRELDISAVSAGLFVRLDKGIVVEARFAYGGMAATPARARHAERAVVGRPWDGGAVEAAAIAMDDDFHPMSDHRGSAWYRSTVAANLILGFYEETKDEAVPTLSDRHTGTVLPREVPR